MKTNHFVLETFQETNITGTLVLKEDHVSPWDIRREYHVEFCTYPNLTNALLSVKDYEIMQMLRILSKVKDAIDKWEAKAAQEDEELSYA